MSNKEQLVISLVGSAIGIALSQIALEVIHEELTKDLVWYDHYLYKTAFKLDWSWMI